MTNETWNGAVGRLTPQPMTALPSENLADRRTP